MISASPLHREVPVLWAVRKRELPDFRGSPSSLAGVSCSKGRSGSSSPAGPLVSALPSLEESTPTHRAGPSSASSSTLHILSPLPPTHFLPWFLAFHCPEVNTPSHTQAAPGARGEETLPLTGRGTRRPPRDEEESRGRPCQPAWHVRLLGVHGTQESRLLSNRLLPTQAPITPKARPPEAVEVLAMSKSSGAQLPVQLPALSISNGVTLDKLIPLFVFFLSIKCGY